MGAAVCGHPGAGCPLTREQTCNHGAAARVHRPGVKSTPTGGRCTPTGSDAHTREPFCTPGGADVHPRGPLFVCPLPGQVQNHGSRSARRGSGIRAHSPRAEVQPRGWRPRAVRGMQARRYRAHPAPRPSPGGAAVLRPPFAARPPPPRTPLLSPGCAARSALPVPAAPGGAAGPHGRRGAAPASGQRGAALSPAEPRSGTGASRSAARGGYERDMMMIDSQVS